MSDSESPRRLQFADISPTEVRPNWVQAEPEGAPASRPITLHPPRLPSKPASALSPILEPRAERKPPARPPEANPPKRIDTLIEQLAPRAEEEVAGAIARALAEFQQLRVQQLEQAEHELLRLLDVIVRRVLAHQVRIDPSLAVGLVREGLAALSDDDQVQVRLGQFFAEGLDDVSDMLARRGVQAEVVIDRALPPHGCCIDTQLGQVDESVETRLDGILAALFDPAEGETNPRDIEEELAP